MDACLKLWSQKNKSSFRFILCLIPVSLVVIIFHIQNSYSESFSSASLLQWRQVAHPANPYNLSFLPLKDLRYSESAMTGNTWFMSSLNDTVEKDEPEYILFPSPTSNGRLLCLKGRDARDGTNNHYALAWRESLPESATFMQGLTFISSTYYNYENLWHGLCAMVPFVRWSMNNKCIKPTRWILYHWGEMRSKMGLWVEKLMEANFQQVNVIDKFEGGDGPYCFEKAVVMRHDVGALGQENKLKVFDLLRCKARQFCGIERREEVNERGIPLIRLTLFMRRGSRSFKNATLVASIFRKECTRVQGCILDTVQSEDLSFCDQVRVMTHTDILASPHGAQLTNMLFMNPGSSVMEFFPKGWLENAGIGQYAHHWMADQSGMHHQGAWWDHVGNECPNPNDKLQCFLFHKDGKVGHNETFFAEWTRNVLQQVQISKSEQVFKNIALKKPCAC